MQEHKIAKIALAIRKQRVDVIDPVFIQELITLYRASATDEGATPVGDQRAPPIDSVHAITNKSRFYAVTTMHFVDVMSAESSRIAAPLPFEYCAVALSAGIELKLVDDGVVGRTARMQSMDREPSGPIRAFPILAVARDFPEKVIMCSVEYGDELLIEFTQINDLELANRIKSIVVSQPDVKPYVPTRGERMLMRKSKKKSPPQPFYLLKAPSCAFKDTPEHVATLCREPLSFRHDRSAHLRLLVERTHAGFDEKRHKLLTSRGYVVYGPGDELGPLASAHFKGRGHAPKEPQEWLALKISKVRDTIVGPEDKPYLPAVRSRA